MRPAAIVKQIDDNLTNVRQNFPLKPATPLGGRANQKRLSALTVVNVRMCATQHTHTHTQNDTPTHPHTHKKKLNSNDIWKGTTIAFDAIYKFTIGFTFANLIRPGNTVNPIVIGWERETTFMPFDFAGSAAKLESQQNKKN